MAELPFPSPALQDVPSSVLESGRAFCGQSPSVWRGDPYPDLPPRWPTSSDLTTACRMYGIRNTQDCVSLDEYGIGGLRLDLLSVDLQTHIIRGFEVKVSRGDFLRDEKWHHYLRFLNYFYFVTPPGIIRPSELPREVYLLEWDVEEPLRKKRRDYGRKDLAEVEEIIGFPTSTLRVVKKGQKLQPRFTRETYTEHFFFKVIMEYVRKLQWREDRWRQSGVCPKCLTVSKCPGCSEQKGGV